MPVSLEKKLSDHLEFIFIGEHPAIDFANTRVVAHGRPLELFLSWQNVVDWLSRAKLTTGERVELPATAGARALAHVVEFRRAWEEALSEIVAGRKVGETFLERLNGFLVPDTFHEIVRRQGRKEFSMIRSPSRLEGEKRALSLIARQIAGFLAEADLSYLRRCANRDSCVLYFYDTTKNHRRQWCSVATCGNRHKVAEFRKRQAHARK